MFKWLIYMNVRYLLSCITLMFNINGKINISFSNVSGNITIEKLPLKSTQIQANTSPESINSETTISQEARSNYQSLRMRKTNVVHTPWEHMSMYGLIGTLGGILAGTIAGIILGYGAFQVGMFLIFFPPGMLLFL